MHTFLDAKQMARALRQGLADRKLEPAIPIASS